MKPFWVYMLRCADSSYYIGHTDDLELRVGQIAFVLRLRPAPRSARSRAGLRSGRTGRKTRSSVVRAGGRTRSPFVLSVARTVFTAYREERGVEARTQDSYAHPRPRHRRPLHGGLPRHLPVTRGARAPPARRGRGHPLLAQRGRRRAGGDAGGGAEARR